MSELALRLIEENKRTKDKFLDLGDCGLRKLPIELSECIWIERLNLGRYYYELETFNWIETKNNGGYNLFQSTISDILEKLISLKFLDLFMVLSDDFDFLEKLTNLTYLNLNYNKVKDFTFLKKLSNLKFLSIRDTMFEDCSFLNYVPHLQYLDISENKINDSNYLLKIKSLRYLDLSVVEIENFTFLSEFSNLKFLSLRENEISNCDFLKNLTQLTFLNLGNNKISSINFLLSLTQLKNLSLNNNLIEKCFALNYLLELESLNLNNNYIQDASFLQNLPKLSILFIANNKIKNWKYLVSNYSLKFLNLANNTVTDCSFLKHLTKLEILDISYVDDIDILFLEKTTTLKSLDIKKSNIVNINYIAKLTQLQSLTLNESNVTDISFLENLTQITSLNLSRNEITNLDSLSKLTLLDTLDLGYNKISYCRFLEKLTSLRFLTLKANEIQEISSLKNLIHLVYLDLSNNKIISLEALENLSKLNNLKLNHNRILDTSPLSNLFQLRALNLANNNIKDISPLVSLLERGLFIELKEKKNAFSNIIIANNPIVSPPIEIITQGTLAIIEYFEQVEKEGLDYIHEAKLTLVGDGGVGKTSLQKRILNKKASLPKKENRTRGIEISEWAFKSFTNDFYKIKIWDFGGQDVYYPVHRFFLTTNSVFVLVGSTRTNIHNFGYWIPTIYQFGGRSPIILVQNCFDGNNSSWNDLGIFFGNLEFNLIKPIYNINLPSKNQGLSILEAAIQQQIIQLPHIGKSVPKSWASLRKQIYTIALKESCISFERFNQVCELVDNESFQDLENVKNVGRFLHSLGIILWFDDIPYLKDWIILQPEWIMKAVYKIIDDEIIKLQKGTIQEADFSRLWNEKTYIGKEELLKQMLIAFKIAFLKKRKKTEFIIPTHLLSIPEEKKWDNSPNNIRLEFRFDFMPHGIINQVSAQLSHFILSDNDVWNNAVIFESNESKAQVLEDFFNRKIYVKAHGKDARALIVMVIDSIQSVVDDYKGVKVSIHVPCNCEICQKIEQPTIFEYEKLLAWSKNKDSIACNESDTILSIKELLYSIGFKVKKDIFNQVFISHNSLNSLIKEHSYFNKEEDTVNLLHKIYQNTEFMKQIQPITINNNPHFEQNNENKSIQNMNVKETKEQQLEDIKEILLDLQELNINNEDWKNALIKSLDEFHRLEMTEDKASQKTSISIIERGFKKLKDLKDAVAISFIPVDINDKLPKLFNLWEDLKKLL